MSEAGVQVSASRGRRIGKFGPNDALLGAITESVGPPQVGAVLWGFGVAEMKTARRLAKHGIVCMQVRIDGPQFNDDEKRNQLYDAFGVSYCQAAMNKLAAEWNVSTFMLMGNCACANICFNTAIVDSRVIGLILTNPHVSKAQIFGGSLWQKVFNARTWKRLMVGKIDIASNTKALGSVIRAKLKLGAKNSAVEATQSGHVFNEERNLYLPPKLNEKLRSMCDRDVRILIACAITDDSFDYLRTMCRKVLTDLRAGGKLWFEKIDADTHVFSTDDTAASRLNETISSWSEAMFGHARTTVPSG